MKKKNKLIYFFVFILLVLILTYFRNKFLLTTKTTITPNIESFSDGTYLLYYNYQGIFQTGTNQTTKPIVSSKVMSYGHPVLSPDNHYLTFYVKNENNSYDLWLYDLTKQENKKILANINLYPGYIQNPLWGSNSKFIFITKRDNDQINRLYKINLQGKITSVKSNYSQNVLWPKLIQDNLISFNTFLPGGNSVGIINLSKKNQTIIVTTPTTSYNSKITFINDDHVLKVNNNSLKVSGPTEKEKIYGLEILNINTGKIETFNIPKDIQIDSTFKRLQPFSSCGKNIILAKIINKNYIGKIDESIDKLYSFNIDNQSITELKGITEQVFSSLVTTPIQCSLNSDNQAFFQNSSNGQKTTSISVIDFTEPQNIQIVNYNDLLSQSILTPLKNKCIEIGVNYYNSDQDFIYLDVREVAYMPQQCHQEEIGQITGLYRLSKKENSTVKILSSDQNGYELIVPIQ